MTADELLEIAREGRPNVRYAKNATDSAIAAWHSDRWVTVAILRLDGKWASLEHELLINGKPVVKQEDWIE